MWNFGLGKPVNAEQLYIHGIVPGTVVAPGRSGSLPQ